MPKCISPIRLKTAHVVPCGKCYFCMQTKANEWSFRIYQEMRVSDSAYFITATYSDENLPEAEENPTLLKSDLQKFIKRLRDTAKRKGEPYNNLYENRPYKSLKYFACGEYGTKFGRPHYHLILFNYPHNLINNIQDVWQLGHTKTGSVSNASITYTTKYMIKDKTKVAQDQQPEFRLMSKNLGINYVEKNYGFHKLNREIFVINANGKKQAMPRRFKDMIFNKHERELIRVEQLAEMDQVYANTREKLEYMYQLEEEFNPEWYMEQSHRFKHESIKNRTHQKDRL